MSKCRKCGEEYEGIRCKPCWAKYMSDWSARNPEKVKRNKKNTYARTKDLDSLRNKKWVEENRKRSNEIKKAYKQRHREKYLASQREYANARYKENREELLAAKKSPGALKVNSEWREKNRERLNAAYLERYHSNPEYKKKNRARWIVHRAVKSGELVKPEKCAICEKEMKLQAHHSDYEKPLDVIWLCVPCHKKIHSKYFKLDGEVLHQEKETI